MARNIGRGAALLLAGLGLAAPARAGVQVDAYAEAVRLVDTLYLHPEAVSAPTLLRQAARGLADDVDWLLVESDADAVYLRHGDGTVIGSLSVASMQTLPEALASLETLVVASGFDTGDVDVRLSILSGMTGGLDRYSSVLSGERLDRFDVRLKGTLVGIGLTVRLQQDHLIVASISPEGPAARGGVRDGDRILRIDGVSTVNMPVREASRRIRGESGTSVTLTLRRGSSELSVSLDRQELVVPNVEHEVLEGDVGYVRITHFSQRTDENLRLALAALEAQGALSRGLVIDLRQNTGGSMKDSARSADQFVHEGLLLRTAGPDGGRVRNLQSRMEASSVGDEPDVPVVILMDPRTASGSEIMAGALVQLGRAALVGTRSFGKGTVQKVYPIDPAARLKLTVARYLLAGGRTIDHDGLAPDLALADVVLDADGMRFRGFDPSETGVERSQVIPVVAESRSWRGQSTPRPDVRLEVARRAVLQARGPSRQALLDALQKVGEEVRAEQLAHLADALKAKAIDWSVTDRPAATVPPAADVRLRAVPDEEDPSRIRLQASVTNLGDEDLEQVLVELSCESFSAWNGVAVPLGRVRPGNTSMGVHVLDLRPGFALREDEVTASLHTAHHPPLLAETAVLQSGSQPIPDIAITARYVPGEAHGVAEITVHNLSDEPLSGVEVAFAHPGDVDIELLTAAARVPALDARASARLSLELRTGPDAPPRLPLGLTVASDGYRGDLAEWPLTLPVDGTAITLQAPTIAAPDLPLSAPVGPWALDLDVQDESRLDHVVVYANGDKIAWASGGRPKAAFPVRFDLLPGENHLVVVATDEQGVQRREVLRVRGEVVAAVDASDP